MDFGGTYTSNVTLSTSNKTEFIVQGSSAKTITYEYTTSSWWGGNQTYTLYLGYEVKVAVENSYASENIMRQMITKESLKKIDEMEAEKKLTNRKKRQMKSLKKQLDNINKMNLNK